MGGEIQQEEKSKLENLENFGKKEGIRPVWEYRRQNTIFFPHPHDSTHCVALFLDGYRGTMKEGGADRVDGGAVAGEGVLHLTAVEIEDVCVRGIGTRGEKK